ncbi:hypothetical protein ACN20G_17825 [Streptomyces sp. BI20]|uniref:hypothetical protein n=1 Tax=Streptomyces sp. BI20 TaxID=3403460 RepID=UPI003C7206A2
MEPAPIPYVTLRSDRRQVLAPLVIAPEGVRWGDDPRPREEQVDPWLGVLRERWEGDGTGEPLWARVDPDAQWECADRLRCGVCGRPAVPAHGGGTWLLHESDLSDAGAEWPGHVDTTTPPVCPDHLADARTRCPALRRAHLTLRTRLAMPVAVIGTIYTGEGAVADALVPLDHPTLSQTVARHLVLRLHNPARVTA